MPFIQSKKKQEKNPQLPEKNQVIPNKLDPIPIPIPSSAEYPRISDIRDIKFYELLGRGSFGEVRSCEIKNWGNELFAIKKIPRSKKDENISSEVAILTNYRHPNIIRVFDYIIHENSIYLIMEKYSTSILKELRQRKTKNSEFTQKEVHFIMESMIKGINFLHSHEKPIIHRDLKSDNILLLIGDSSQIEKVCITDFGISREIENGRQYNSYVGTEQYMAPEIEPRGASYSFPADIWAFGVVSYELVCLEIAYRAELIKLKGELPSSKLKSHKLQCLVPIIESCLQKDPKMRKKSKEILKDLENIRTEDENSSDEDESFNSKSKLCSLHEKRPNLKKLNFTTKKEKNIIFTKDEFQVLNGPFFPYLSTLNIKKCDFLEEVVLQIPSLRTLCFDRCDALKKLKVSAPYLQTVEFKYCNKISYTDVVDGFKECRNIETFEVKGCAQLDNSCLQMIPTLAFYKNLPLEFEIILQDIIRDNITTLEINESHGSLALRALSEATLHCKSIRRLSLKNNIDMTSPLLSKMLRNNNIESLVFELSQISDEIAKVIANSRELRNISFRECILSDSGILLIATAVQSSGKMRSLELCKMGAKNFIFPKSNITSLTLESIEDFSSTLLLVKNCNLQRFFCRKNKLDEKSILTLLEVIDTCTQLRELELVDCDIDDNKLKILSSFKNPSLESIILDNNNITALENQMLLRIDHLSLRVLSLANNNIQSSGFKELCSFLSLNNTLQKVDVRNNRINSVTDVISVLSKNQTLKTLIVKGNKVMEEEKRKILESDTNRILQF